MAVLTSAARFGRAKAFVTANADKTWFGFGTKATYSAPTGEETDLETTYCYKKADTVVYVKQNPDAPEGTYINYNGQKWVIIDESTAQSENCRWVYVQAMLDNMEYMPAPVDKNLLGQFVFKQVCVRTGVTPAASYTDRVLLRKSGFGYGGNEAIEDEFVLTGSVMEILDNLEDATTHKTTYEDTIGYIIQF